MTNPSMPGDFTHDQKVARMIRVNHAGEYGAGRIYQGQIAALKNSSCRPMLEHMQAQERKHLETFDKMLTERHIRPTILHPLWHIAGFALGYVTGKMGEKAAMACTVAIEEVIDEHYHDQENELKDLPQEHILHETVAKFRQEELEHRDLAITHKAQEVPFYNLLTAGIKTASRAAIWLSKRF